MANISKDHKINVPLWALGSLALFGLIIAFIGVSGPVPSFIALGLLIFNAVWAVKLFRDKKSMVTGLFANQRAAVDGLQGKLPVPVWYLATLMAAALLPLVLWLLKVAVAIGLVVAAIGLVVFVVLWLKGRGKAATNPRGSSAPWS